jgi:predicted AAA+ superfamily ATPase
MPRQMIDNERSTAVIPGEDGRGEGVALRPRSASGSASTRAAREPYLAMVARYVEHFGLGIEPEAAAREALEWAMTRGGRSGRVAWQYIQDLAGRLGRTLETAASR